MDKRFEPLEWQRELLERVSTPANMRHGVFLAMRRSDRALRRMQNAALALLRGGTVLCYGSTREAAEAEAAAMRREIDRMAEAIGVDAGAVTVTAQTTR